MNVLPPCSVFFLKGEKWPHSPDQDAPLLPQSISSKHSSGKEDRCNHGGGEREETRPLCIGYWVSIEDG